MRIGIIYILVATLAFAVMNALAKELSNFHPLQVVFFRAFGTFIFIFPYMLSRGISIRGNNPKFLLLRGIVGFLSLATFFIAIQRIPLGSAVTMRYLGPIFGAIAASYFLRERINVKQWLSFAVAFIGVLVLKGFDLRIDGLSLGLLLVSAIFVGLVFVLIRYLSDKEHHLTIISYFMLVCIFSSLFFISKWRVPQGEEWFSVIGIGVAGLIGQVYMTRGFKTEEASVLAPFKYMELVYALFIGFLIYDERYALLPLIGILCIVIGMISNIIFKDKVLVNTQEVKPM